MNGTMIQYFHWYTEGDGKLWEEVQQNAEYLAELGITMVWLPPAYKANGGGFSVGYDPYDLSQITQLKFFEISLWGNPKFRRTIFCVFW